MFVGCFGGINTFVLCRWKWWRDTYRIGRGALIKGNLCCRIEDPVLCQCLIRLKALPRVDKFALGDANELIGVDLLRVLIPIEDARFELFAL